MNNKNNPIDGSTETETFVSRVIKNDALKKGAAAGLAGLLVAVVTEALWPTES